MEDRENGAAASPKHHGNEDAKDDKIQKVHQNSPDTATATGNSSKFKQLWDKAGLDMQTLAMMLKGSLPPTIAIAMYQARDVAAIYQTLGYLVAIASILGMAVMPRGLFVQNMLLNILAICIASATNLLALYSAVQARLHTTAPGSPSAGYNSSASAVLAVWLIFQTYVTNALRARVPQFQFPAILYSIFMIVSLTYGTQFASMASAVAFMKRLLEAFLSGFGIAAGVSFFVFPVSSRKVVFGEMKGYLGIMGGMLMTQAAYLRSLETFDPEILLRQREAESKNKRSRTKSDATSPLLLATMPEALKLKDLLGKLYALHAKLPVDVNFAKREIAIGKLSSKDISDVHKKMRQIMVPISGLNTILDILQRRAETAGWPKEAANDQEVNSRKRQIDNLHEMMHTLHEPFAAMSVSINRAFQHILIALEIEKSPKKKQDEENTGDRPTPGSTGFAESLKAELDEFFDSKKRSVREWCHEHDVELPEDFFQSSFVGSDHFETEHFNESHQRQLFFVLYVEYLLWRAGQSALELVLHVDQRKQEGALSKTRLIVPGGKTLRKWVFAAFGQEDTSDESHYTADMDQGGNTSLYLGESFSKRKDPEHLPPRNAWEKFGEIIRLFPRALRSDASAFGLRVTAATMSIAIVCYLRDTQAFFLRNRLLWAMIMVPISMTRTAGQSTGTFALRIIGTFIAMVGAYVVWYIVDGKTAGVIAFLWFWIFCAFYVFIKKPKLIIVSILSIVTAILIIGYELQTKVIGIQITER